MIQWRRRCIDLKRLRHAWVLVLLAAQPAQARIHLPGEPGAEATEAEAEPEDTTVAAVSLRAGYFGAVVPGGGAEVAWRLPNLELGLNAAYGREGNLASALGSWKPSTPSLSGYGVSDLALAGTLIQAQGRYFLPGDFTVTLGLGWRRLAGHVGLRETDGAGAALAADATVTGHVATATVGNLWSWPNGFFVGADWIGLALPLDAVVQVTTQGTSPAAADLAAQTKDLAGMLGRVPALILLYGTVGWRF